MTDIWSFLLQTLTASSAAVLLLLVKAMFRDKLSPRWQFAAWGILALVLLFPAGLGGRYALVNWPVLLEAFKSWATGDYGSVTQVLAPIPLPSLTLPTTVLDWLYLFYVAGVLLLFLHYLLSYARLRVALQRETATEDPMVQAVAQRYYLPTCPVIRVPGLSSAFVCGVFHPVLALPAEVEPDEKVILHELLHLIHRDVTWGLVICFFRCLHWCNPLLWFCANLAQNDLEARCDQRVLEQLEGEARRQYGHILLSMADEKYARAPGTSSMANGLRNIRRRIQAIARFKMYPAGMSLVSVCMVLVLAAPLLVGAKQEVTPAFQAQPDSIHRILAHGRTLRCTTYAGALDTYAKAFLVGALNRDYQTFFSYLSICTPLSQQKALAEAYMDIKNHGTKSPILPADPDTFRDTSVYRIYNLVSVGKESYEGILAIPLLEPPPGENWVESGESWIAVQTVRAEKQGNRWVVLPQGDFSTLAGPWRVGGLYSPTTVFPFTTYEAQAGDFTIHVNWQTMCYVESIHQDSSYGFSYPYFSLTPEPDGKFTIWSSEDVTATYTGSPEQRNRYDRINLYAYPNYPDSPAVSLPDPNEISSENGIEVTEKRIAGGERLSKDWKSPLHLSMGFWHDRQDFSIPDSYTMRLSFNGEAPEELLLLPMEGGTPHD